MIIDRLSSLIIMMFANKRLRSYEDLCLERWTQSLSLAGRERLALQLKKYNYVQRQSQDKLVCFYSHGDPACQRWTDTDLFPLQLDVVTAATVTICNVATSVSMTVGIVMTRGRFFGLEFSSPPKVLLGKTLAINRFVRHFDPEEPLSREAEPPVDARQRFIESIQAILPTEYLELCETMKSRVVSSIRVLGLAEIERLTLPDTSYYVIAESSSERLAVAADSATLIAIHKTDDGDYRVTSESFATWMNRHQRDTLTRGITHASS